MELRQLEHFVAVAEESHFTRAAELLQISQSGLSASIRALETELGTPLFVRSTRRVELTEAGRVLLAESHRTLASVAAAHDAVAAVRGVLRGTLSVGGEQCLGVVDVPAQLARFRSRHPGVEIRLRFGGSAQLIDLLAAGRLDVALVAVTGPAPRGVVMTPLAAEPLVVLCHPDHELATAGPATAGPATAGPATAGPATTGPATTGEVSLADLDGLTFVGFQPDWGARVLADRAFAAAGLPHRVELEVNDVHTLLDLVGHNLGVAIVPAPIAAKKRGKLHVTALRGDLPGWHVAAAASDNPSPAARALLAQLTQRHSAGSAGASPDGASPGGASPGGASPDGASPDGAGPGSASSDSAGSDSASPDAQVRLAAPPDPTPRPPQPVPG
jgi:DNA-binding transcriptional LysR family regulator